MSFIITKKQSNFIKLIAILTMLIDHIGLYLYPYVFILRIIGRVSFPLFAYQLTIGFSKTSSKKKYIENLVFFGLIAQIPYYFLTEELRFNILFSLVLGVLAMLSIEKKKYYYLLLIIPASFFVSYKLYGLIIILIFYLFKNKADQFILFSVSTLYYSLYLFYLQLFAVFSFLFIIKPSIGINLPNKFFYIFYPTHLFIILLIKMYFFNNF